MSVFRSASKWLWGRGRPAAVRKPSRARLGLEALGDRIVPSTFHVTTLADAGPGSLRAAVAGANAHAGADTIDFQPGLAGTIALTGGQLDITDHLTITDPGADRLTVSGSNPSRVFKVEAGEAVSISGLTVAGGNAGDGNGGIENFGALTVSSAAIGLERPNGEQVVCPAKAHDLGG